MANKVMYQIVGRYMSGKEVTGYHLQGDNGKSGKFTRGQVCFLVGREQVTNCSAQIYQDKVILRGVGMSLEDLPVQKEDGTLSNTESIGKVRKNTSAADAMTQLILTHSIVSGRQTVGYVVRNAGGATKNISRNELLALAKAGRIGNARYQESKGKPILRGVGVNLNDLPTIDAASAGLSAPVQAKAQQSGGTAPWDNPSNYRKTRKTIYKIHAYMPPEGTRVHNKLENANYVTNGDQPFVLRGTVGEEWVIAPKKLMSTYTFANGKPITEEALSSRIIKTVANGKTCSIIKPFVVMTKPSVDVWAIHVPTKYVFEVATSWGDKLTINRPGIPHGQGDHIVCADANGKPNLQDRWVVNGEIFRTTYDTKALLK